MKLKYIVTLLLSLILFSCSKGEEKLNIILPETPVVSHNSRWGVVRQAYVRVRNKPGVDSTITSALRRGSIVKIIKSTDEMDTIGKSTAFWYYAVSDDMEGWVFGTYLSLFDSKEQALTASGMYK